MRTFLEKKLGPKDKGFTLIELLVVIIIIGILAAITIPIFLSQRKKGFEASQKSDARSIATQMETFYTDSQVYPGAVDLVAVPGRVTFGSHTAGTDGILGNADDVNVIDANSDYVVLSPNNAVDVWKSSGTGGFCIEVQSTSTDKKSVYDSGNGGLKPMVLDAAVGAGGGCDTAVYTVQVVNQ